MSPSESAVDSQNSISQTTTQLYNIHTLLFRDFIITLSGSRDGRQTVNNVNKYPQTLQCCRRKMTFRVFYTGRYILPVKNRFSALRDMSHGPSKNKLDQSFIHKVYFIFF